MKIDEKVFEKAFAGYTDQVYSGVFSRMLEMVCRRVLRKYLAEIEKPICIKKLKKNTMIIRGEHD